MIGNPRRIDIECEPEEACRRLTKLAAAKIAASAKQGRYPLATADDAAQAAVLAELEARRRGMSAPETARYKAMDEEITRSASVAETPFDIVRRSDAQASLPHEGWRLYASRASDPRAVLRTFRRAGALAPWPKTFDEQPDVLERDLLLSLVDALPGRVGPIVAARYGLRGEREQTLEQLGARFGICRDRVRQQELEGLRMIRKKLEALDSLRALRLMSLEP